MKKMGMGQNLQMRLSQQLIMTPQLQQAIKLLQLSRGELEELINQALIENPTLEERQPDEEPAEEKEHFDENVPEVLKNTDNIETARQSEKEDVTPEEWDWQKYAELGMSKEGRKTDKDDEIPFDATLAQTQTLTDHLIWQLDMLRLDALEHQVGTYLIGNIGDNGYLTMSIKDVILENQELSDDITEWLKENPDAELPPLNEKLFDTQDSELKGTLNQDFDIKIAQFVERILKMIMGFDPPGVGARSLQECLLIQLELMDLKSDLSYQIVLRNMDLLQNKDLKRIARLHKASLERVLEAYKLIMSLEPKPGRSFGSAQTDNYIIPDVYIYRSNTSEYKVALNESGMPHLKINNYYQNLASTIESNEQNSLTKEYINEKIKAGEWLMKSIEQRQRTIYKVTQSLLKFQHEFFEKGIHYLKPLVLKDVAEDINVHESTVSRITTNKYMHTPQGIFELKYFFTSGVEQGEGETISSKRIKEIIEQLIQRENPKSPYTDLQIAKILLDRSNIRIARRTIAKYREAMNILPSNRRKKLF